MFAQVSLNFEIELLEFPREIVLFFFGLFQATVCILSFQKMKKGLINSKLFWYKIFHYPLKTEIARFRLKRGAPTVEVHRYVVIVKDLLMKLSKALFMSSPCY